MTRRSSCGIVAACVAFWLAGCGKAPPAPATDEPTAVTSDASEASEATPSFGSSASSSASPSADALAALSGQSPPPEPPQPSSSASAKRPSAAKLAEINHDLARLQLEMIAALGNSGNATDKTINDGKAMQGLLDNAAASRSSAGRLGDLNTGRGGGGSFTPGAGGGGLGSLGSSSGIKDAPGSTIGGKAAKDLTADDLDKALGRAGCTTSRLDSPSQPPSPGAIFEARCAPRTFVVSFVPAGGARPDAKAIAEMERLGSTWKEGGLFLAIVPKDNADRAAAIELMNKLRTSDGASGSGSPRGNAAIGGAAVSGGAVDNASAVVAGMAAGFRRCYSRGLKEDPTMKGSLRITAKIGKNGEVLSASPAGGGGLSETVKSCAVAVVSSRSFSSPDSGSATIVIPVSFFPAE